MEPQCPICAHSEGNAVHVAQEMLLGYGDKFEYGECSACRCLWLMSPPENMSRHYPKDYQRGRTGTVGGLGRLLGRLRNRYAVTGRGLAGRILYRMRPNLRLRALRGLELDRSARILDVGCGDGAVVEDLRLLGYEHTLGIDPMRLPDDGSGREPFVERRTLDQIDGTWDTVMFHHSFEHLADPRAALQQVASLLTADGVCVVRLPVVPCYAWEHYGTHWVQLDPPRHLFIHSRRSLGILSAAAGLTIARYYHDSGAFQFWGSERYRAGLSLRTSEGRTPVARAQLREYARAADTLNRMEQGDQAVFVLRRRAGRVRPN